MLRLNPNAKPFLSSTEGFLRAGMRVFTGDFILFTSHSAEEVCGLRVLHPYEDEIVYTSCKDVKPKGVIGKASR